MKYIIEGDVNFFDELKKLDDNKDLNNSCLISGETLTDYFVIMDCGHKFNYIPLFKDICNHKKKYNSMESTEQKLNLNEIRCPYCRNKQKGILPYYSELGIEKINGVNFINYETKLNCETKPITKSNNNYKKCEFILCNSLIKKDNIKNSSFLPCYCNKHKKMMIVNQEKQEKQEIQQAKLKAKEDEKNAKLLLNKNISSKIDELNNQIQEENIMLDIPNTCNKILKSGVNKGLSCKNKIFKNDLCKRHFLKQEILNS
jgi:hypothetical protein